MANKTLKKRFYTLLEEVKENISDQSLRILETIASDSGSSIYEYKDKLFNALEEEYEIIREKMAKEYGGLFDDYENDHFGNLWDEYSVTMDLMGEDIYKYPQEDTEPTQGYEGVIKQAMSDNLINAVIKVKSEFQITGEVIDFFLHLFDQGMRLCFY